MKPISSILSASSRTNISTSFNEINPWFIRSSNLPGVATSISTPFRKSICLGILIYPSEYNCAGKSCMTTICFKTLLNLYCQFPCWSNNKTSYFSFFVNMICCCLKLENWNCKCTCFSCSCLGTAYQICSLKYNWYCLFLYWCWYCVTLFFN